MYKFVITRLIGIIPIVLGVVFITFTIMSLTPGDPGRLILGNTATQESVDDMNRQLGYDQPFFLRFATYVKNAVTKLDLGKSYINQKPVFDEIFLRFPTTLKMGTLAVLFSALIGIPLGIVSAVKQYSILDASSTFLALFLASIPSFWFGMMLIRWFAVQIRIFPTNGIESWLGFVLPTITMAFPGSASLLRMTRTTMLETIRQDYIRTARAKGASEKTVILNHALKNALLPIITSLGMTFGALLGGTVIVETVFGLPGLGTLIINAIRMKDVPMVMAATIFLATIFCIIILVVDILYAFIDPRIKAAFSGKR